MIFSWQRKKIIDTSTIAAPDWKVAVFDMTTDAHIVINTCPDADTAQRIAGALVEENLAACVNIIDNVRSVYRWQGKLQKDNEVLLLIKSPASRFTALQDRLQELHPYELPEIVAVPINDGLPGYLSWINNPGQ